MPNEITPEQIAEWRKVCDAATPGPFVAHQYTDDSYEIYLGDGSMVALVYGGLTNCDNGKENAEFFAIAREAMPQLLDMLSHTPPPDLQGTAKLAQQVVRWSNEDGGFQIGLHASPQDIRQLAAGYLALYAAAPKSAERIAKLEAEVAELERELAFCNRTMSMALETRLEAKDQP